MVGGKGRRAAIRWLIPAAIIVLVPSYWITSEVLYAHRISPKGVATVGDYLKLKGNPTAIWRYKHKDGIYCYELWGHLPKAPFIMAFPSSPAAYVFDENGIFMDWCADPGDKPSFRGRWPNDGAEPVDISAYARKYGKK